MDKANLSRIEAGKVLPTLGTLKDLADALGVYLTELFADADELNAENFPKVSQELLEKLGQPDIAFLWGMNQSTPPQSDGVDEEVMDGEPSTSGSAIIKHLPMTLPEYSSFRITNPKIGLSFRVGDTLTVRTDLTSGDAAYWVFCADGYPLLCERSPDTAFGRAEKAVVPLPRDRTSVLKTRVLRHAKALSFGVVTELRRGLING